MNRVRVVVIAAAVAITASAPRARACGVSASGAPAGICDASDVIDDKKSVTRDRIGVSYGYTDSVLFFSNNLRAPTERHALMASYEHPLKNHFTLEAGAGSLLGGYLITDSGKATFSPGVLADVSLSHLIKQAHAYAEPFVLLSFTLAGVWAFTTLQNIQTSYVAFDFSAAVAAGVSLKIKSHAITPFIAGRLFGGPVFWEYRGSSTLGTDAYKYSLGPGLAVSVDHARLTFAVGASLLGEKNLKGGVSVSF